MYVTQLALHPFMFQVFLPKDILHDVVVVRKSFSGTSSGLHRPKPQCAISLADVDLH